jgi:hypothetical protein
VLLGSNFSPRGSLYLLALAGILGCNAIAGIQKAHEDSGDDGNTDACQVDIDEDFIRGCVFRLGCDPLEPVFNLSSCLTFKLQGVLPGERATLNADKCSTVEESIGRRYEPPGACGTSNGWSCSEDGKVATYCGSDADPFSRDCNVVGSECTVRPDEGASAQPCGFPDRTTCDVGETRQTICEGNLQLGCSNGTAVGFDCSALELTCFETDTGATCAPSGASCDPSTPASCTGDDIRLCSAAGVASIFECHKGSKCEETPATGCYVPDCTPEETCEERCEGTEAHFCISEVAAKRDCQDYGFDKCVESTLVAGGAVTVVARCAMNDGVPPPGTSADWSGSPNPGTGGSSNPGTGGSPNPGTGGESSGDICSPLDDPLGCSSVELCVASLESCYFFVEGVDEVPFSCDAEDGGLSALEKRCGAPSAPG